MQKKINVTNVNQNMQKDINNLKRKIIYYNTEKQTGKCNIKFYMFSIF